jgi:guanylate kinase
LPSILISLVSASHVPLPLASPIPLNSGYLPILDTTRSPRAGEIHGKEYYFTDIPTFKTMIEDGQFLEWAIYAGNYYGTSLAALTDLQGRSKVPILDIDLEGVKSVHRLNDRVQARFVFIKTPDMATLAARLSQRGSETEDSLQLRLQTAQTEIMYAERYPETHDIVIVNDSLDTAFAQLETFLFHEPPPSHS